MASLRVCTLGRSFLSRGSPTRIASAAFRSTKVGIVTTQRQFTSNLWLRQEAAQEHSTIGQPMVPAKDIPEAQRNKNARSVAVLALPKEWTRADLETLFQQNGLQIVDLSLRLDRFTFNHDRKAAIELESAEQAQKAIELLHNHEPNIKGAKIYVVPLKSEYEWEIPTHASSRGTAKVDSSDAGLEAAIQPIIDGRRLMFSVLPPGWADLKARVNVRNEANRDVIKRTLEPYGIEVVGRASTNWGDKSQTPRFLAFVDMKTKQGADEAIRKVNDTVVQGLPVALQLSQMPAWKAYRLGQVDKERLAMLQEKGLAPPPEEIDEERYSQPFHKKSVAEKRDGKMKDIRKRRGKQSQAAQGE